MREFYPLDSVDTDWYEAECLQAVRAKVARAQIVGLFDFFGLTIVSIDKIGARPDSTILIGVRRSRDASRRELRFPIWRDPPLGPSVTTHVPDAGLFSSNVVDSILEDG